MIDKDILEKICFAEESEFETIEKLADLFFVKAIGDTKGRYMSNEEFDKVLHFINQKIEEYQTKE